MFRKFENLSVFDRMVLIAQEAKIRPTVGLKTLDRFIRNRCNVVYESGICATKDEKFVYASKKEAKSKIPYMMQIFDMEKGLILNTRYIQGQPFSVTVDQIHRKTYQELKQDHSQYKMVA